MKRRKFIQTLAPVAVMPALLRPFSVQAFPTAGRLAQMFSGGIPKDRKSVV